MSSMFSFIFTTGTGTYNKKVGQKERCSPAVVFVFQAIAAGVGVEVGMTNRRFDE